MSNDTQNESIFFQPSRKTLTIPNEDTFQDVDLKAITIAREALESGKQVFVCMMHTPTREQLADLTTEAVRAGAPVALLGGHLGLMTALIRRMTSYNIACFEAKSERVSVETVEPDGSVVKTSKFVYGGLRPLA